MGVICKVADRFQVVEYSEISEVTRNLRDSDNDLLYNAGNICNHFLNTEFLNQLCRLAHTLTMTKIKALEFTKFLYFLYFYVGIMRTN